MRRGFTPVFIILLLLLILFPVIVFMSGKTLNFRPRAFDVGLLEPLTPPNPSPSLTPIPTPLINRIPVITTSSLPIGQRNTQYQTTVSGYDPDMTDTLTMTALGLPANLTLGSCQSNLLPSRKSMRCTISGVPVGVGTSNVTLTLEDNHGGTTSKSFYLKVAEQ